MKVFPFACLVMLSASTAMAEPKLGDAVFHRFDRDGDGIVSAAELPDQEVRDRFDENGDGDVTLAEFRARTGGAEPSKEAPNESAEESQAVTRLNSFIRKMDANGDGALSHEETGKADWFGRVDRNKDGTLDSGEIERVRKLVAKFGDKILPDAPENPVTEEEIASITSGPEILKPGEVGIGRRVDDASFVTRDGSSHSIAEVERNRGAIFAMTSATCPVSKRYLPTLVAIAKEASSKGVPVILVNPFTSETEEEISDQLAPYPDAPFLYVRDEGDVLSRAFGATTTTEVFLIDSAQTLVYRGAVDDQYGIDYSLTEPRRNFLRDALGSLLGKGQPDIAATAAPGCELDIRDMAGSTEGKSDVTYHRDVARILQRNCVECHNDEGIAPFALDDFAEVDDRARVIRRVIEEGTMPPWFASSEDGSHRTQWANDRSLSEKEKSDLLAWLDSPDRPMGNPDEAPTPRTFDGGWTLGEPDFVVPLSRAYDIKATGFMPYQKDTVVTKLTEDKWVSGYEILPSERDVVHHVIVHVSEPGSTFRDLGEAGGYWAAYVPGNGAVHYPAGFARKLPAGAKIHFQIHYTPSGEAKKERLKLGLHFADEAPRYEVRTIGVADRKLEIPPGEARHEEGTSRKVPFDMAAIGFMPHMHTRGAAFRYELERPGGETESILDIPRYDFNWQLRYELKNPMFIPQGSTIRVTGVFDNSEGNLANPDPTKTVKWGDQTVDEMLIGYVEYFVPVEESPSVAARE